MTQISSALPHDSPHALPMADPQDRAALTLPGHGLLHPATPRDPAQIEDGQLQRLLRLVGPDLARDLLDRLIEDLGAIGDGLAQSGAGGGSDGGSDGGAPDWLAIRNHSHVLIALAGTIGVLRLQTEAEALNQLAHRADAAALDGALHRVVTLLATTVAFVRDTRAQHPAPSLASHLAPSS